MSDAIISVENLSKKYRIGVRQQQGSSSITSTLAGAAKSPFRYFSEMRRPPTDEETLWALHDVSFQVRRGEVVGLVGRNGAGKSTLLKILSRITDPTEGRAVIHGRVGSLLEVGTGFHPDLTGRENIYLNGTILGMRRGEIERKFDEIVAFSEIEKFIDTPVKRYSSGMYVRLAFAVAAHLEPEILMVDEVLAVGDLAFQKKCLGKMENISAEGRTVLFVSHNMDAVRDLCPRSILLRNGEVVVDDTTSIVQREYYSDLRHLEIDADTAVNDARHRRGSGAVRYTGISVLDGSGNPGFEFSMGDTIRFTLDYHVFNPVDEIYADIVLRSGRTGEPVTSAARLLTNRPQEPGFNGTFTIDFPNVNLRPGEYPLTFWLGTHLTQAYDVVDQLTLPLIITAEGEWADLGFHTSKASGFYNIGAQLIENSVANGGS